MIEPPTPTSTSSVVSDECVDCLTVCSHICKTRCATKKRGRQRKYELDPALGEMILLPQDTLIPRKKPCRRLAVESDIDPNLARRYIFSRTQELKISDVRRTVKLPPSSVSDRRLLNDL